jgi:hypothetical protein
MILPLLEREKINNSVPIFTLDVNQIALRQPTTWVPEMDGLAQLEWNYFEIPNVELCVTPETPFEITAGVDVSSLGARAYERFQKSQLFKSRPAGTTLSLVDQEANELWVGIKEILWPSIPDRNLTTGQRADVSQLFFHTIASSTKSNAAFLTIDTNFHDHKSEIRKELGIHVLTPREAWRQYEPMYGLYEPTDVEVLKLWQDQQMYFRQLWEEAEL